MQLFVDAANVRVDRRHADVQRVGDFLVKVATREQFQNLALANTTGVSVAPVSLIASLSSGVLIVSWPADHTGWRLLAQTNNLAKGVSENTNDWGTVAGSTTTNEISLPVNTGSQPEFYRLVYP